MTQAGADWVKAEQLAEYMRQRGLRRLRVPDSLLPEEVAAYRRLKESHYFLVRNRGPERFRCSVAHLHNCNGFHEFLTYMGVYRPFRGLEGALWGYAQVRRDSNLSHKLLEWAPHLGAGHPQLARELQPSEPGVDLIAVAIGVLESISKTRADSLLADINAKGPPVPLRL